jgi:tRNA/rRNA methyltransferase
MAETKALMDTGGRAGILFGAERTGLDSDEIAIADSIITFPVNPAYASLNLAQAVLLCGYEWFRAAHGDGPRFVTPERSVPAPREMVVAFFDFFESKLDENGFFRPANKKPNMQRNLRNMIHRMELTEQDVRTLWGAVVRLSEGPRLEAKTRRRKKTGASDAGEAAADVAASEPADEINPINTKTVTYEITGPPNASGRVSYLDVNGKTLEAGFTSLPWSVTVSTTL